MTSTETLANITPGRYLCFSLGQEKFAIPLLQVKEVIGNLQFTPIPQSPPYFKGIVNLRGQIISVVDLRQRLKVNSKASGSETTTIILDLGSINLGVVVDSVDYVKEYTNEHLSEPPKVESAVDSKFVQGIAREESDLVLLLNLQYLLNPNDLQIVTNVSKAS